MQGRLLIPKMMLYDDDVSIWVYHITPCFSIISPSPYSPQPGINLTRQNKPRLKELVDYKHVFNINVEKQHQDVFCYTTEMNG